MSAVDAVRKIQRAISLQDRAITTTRELARAVAQQSDPEAQDQAGRLAEVLRLLDRKVVLHERQRVVLEETRGEILSG